MKKIVIGLLGLVLLTGCGPVEVDQTTDILVGTINGKPLRRVEVSSQGSIHFIYYFPTDSTQPVSNNYRAGKVSHVVVFIDGKAISTNTIILEDR